MGDETSRVMGPGAEALLDWFDLDAADADEVREAAARIAADPDERRRVGEVCAVLRQTMGVPRPWEVAQLPRRYDAAAGDAPLVDRWFYAVAFLAFLPETLAYHRAHGVAEEVSRATFADVGRHVRIHERTFGRPGFHQHGWISIHMRGLLYDLGRLQLNLTTVRLPTETLAAAGMQAAAGDVVLDTHIPDSGPLADDEVTASFERAPSFFAAHFGDHAPYRYACCTSWLLDRQLPGLVPGTNIDRFCRRWTPIEQGPVTDASALEFIFRRPGVPLADLPRDTRLQRAVIDHLQAGGHLHLTTGYLTV